MATSASSDSAQTPGGALAEVSAAAPGRDLPALVQKLSCVLDLPAGEILAVVAAGAPMVGPVLAERLETRTPKLLVVLLQAGDDLETAGTALAILMRKHKDVEAAAICTISKYDGGWFIPAIVSRDATGLADIIRRLLAPESHIISCGGANPAKAAKSSSGPLILDQRVMRMARLAVASSSAVILVGPPGTGKTSFIRQLLQETAYDPAAMGLSAAPKEAKWVTPTESWTAGDLLGGMGVDHAGRKRFRLGHLLEAIRQDRWLVLDEANRANMDRIFGPMLTWLADQRVELGPASGDTNSPPIVLDWNDKPQCDTVRLDLLESERIMVSDPIRFLAGQDWRLLGTFNAQDAVKVFGFGGALSRRFSHVPIPPIKPSQFQRALAPRVRGLPPEVSHLVLGLYAAHLHTQKAMLGPAIFLKVADYVHAGLMLAAAEKRDQAPHNSGIEITGRPCDDDEMLLQLVAEGYLTSAGTFLGHLAPADLETVGAAVVQGGLSQDQWEWIRGMLPTLS